MEAYCNCEEVPESNYLVILWGSVRQSREGHGQESCSLCRHAALPLEAAFCYNIGIRTIHIVLPVTLLTR